MDDGRFGTVCHHLGNCIITMKGTSINEPRKVVRLCRRDRVLMLVKRFASG